jgi:RimJ/RimL family protein N-acetyltransferase
MSYADEVTRSEDEWRALVRNDDDRLRVFGLFAGDELIGLTGVFTDRNDPSGQTAVLGMSYIAPPYRGRGLSRLFYEARLAWARANTKFRKVRVSHRRSNEASGRANRRYGFVQLGVVERVWPDGSNDDEIHYELDLR